LKNLKARIERHLKREKKLKWHIDYFLTKARVIDVITFCTNKKIECKLAKYVQNLPGAEIVVKGFGSSDCKCITHLFHFNKNPARMIRKFKKLIH